VDRADRIVSISNYTRHEVLRHLEVDGKKLSVIYNGLAVPSINQQKPAFVPNKKFFFTLGIIAFKKNFHVLLPILKRFHDYVLIIAGNSSGAYAKQIRNKASSLGIADRVLLPGEISEEEKQWLYSNCEAFLFPSLTEGFGLPVIEAMAFGKPVFISKLTSLPEIGGPHAYYFHDFQTDYMIETIESGLKDHLENPAKKIEIQKWASKFSWDAAGKEYLQLYSSLLS
jgi:glycosyltransferase involved in cell wall biosynthesis